MLPVWWRTVLIQRTPPLWTRSLLSTTMPLQRSHSSKRKLSPEEEENSQATKRTRSSSSPPESQSPSQSQSQSQSQSKAGDRSSQPTNTSLPTEISFPPRLPGTTRVASWNVCGLASSQKKGFKKYVEAEDPDILVLTETKVNNVPVDPALNTRYPHSYWSISDKKTYSGTAVLSKTKPLSVTKNLPGHPQPSLVKGRIVTLEFEGCYLIATYVVNAGMELKTLNEKKEWNIHFRNYIRDLDKIKPVIWTGDLNVAPTANDLSNAKKNWNKTAGYTEAETTAFREILEPPESCPDANKFVDVWRQRHPDEREYSYFSYRFNCRKKGLGWRIDMFVLSESIAERVELCEIRSDIYGASDHCPVVMEIACDVFSAPCK